MADKPTKSEEEHRPTEEVHPLNYAPPDRSNSFRKVGATIGGVIVSVFAIALVGAIGYPLHAPTTGPAVRIGGVVAWLVLGAGALAVGVVLWARRPLEAGRWFLMGLLIGTGLAALLEGACYASL